MFLGVCLTAEHWVNEDDGPLNGGATVQEGLRHALLEVPAVAEESRIHWTIQSAPNGNRATDVLDPLRVDTLPGAAVDVLVYVPQVYWSSNTGFVRERLLALWDELREITLGYTDRLYISMREWAEEFGGSGGTGNELEGMIAAHPAISQAFGPAHTSGAETGRSSSARPNTTNRSRREAPHLGALPPARGAPLGRRQEQRAIEHRNSILSIEWDNSTHWVTTVSSSGIENRIEIAAMPEAFLHDTLVWAVRQRLQLVEICVDPAFRDTTSPPLLFASRWLLSQPAFISLARTALACGLTFPQDVYAFLEDMARRTRSENRSGVTPPYRNIDDAQRTAALAANLRNLFGTPTPPEERTALAAIRRELRDLQLDDSTDPK